ncbi:hypothetical protein [Geobacter sp. DSM 9736]|uniref:hypothetical protein n=1 Tax=Geobacter sp. DSM 9736 TaxID=1277350 RepID=UPI000B50AF6F|nr:hypothetical protein [Geobacter sp. DSM 9736]SNB47706.1 hypothetical protein SAMN06269301_3198 [Geobacter sp. DSM 9736]
MSRTGCLTLSVAILVAACLSAHAGEFGDGAKQVGHGFKKMGTATGKAAKKSGKAVGKAFKKAGKETGKAFSHAGKEVGRAFKE